MTKRIPIEKGVDGLYFMSVKNIRICNKNQDRYGTPELNDALELHYYGFSQIDNLQPYSNINTLYLNNNVISTIENLSFLTKLVTLNLANNRISTIQGLDQLTELVILDLSGNQIQKVGNIRNLQKLATLNLSGNVLAQPNSISELCHNPSLTCLHLSNNPLQDDQQLFCHLQKIPLLTLFLKETKFSRGVPSYRKETIYRLKKLTFLDDRPVTSDERMMAEAWKTGGLVAQREARKQIKVTSEEKNKKIFQQMMERSQKIEKLRDDLFNRLAANELQELEVLKGKISEETKKDIVNQRILQQLRTQVQELEAYLTNFRVDVNDMDVSQKRQIPNNLCERHEADAIYIYGVSEEQLEKIKQAYYPDQNRPLIAKDFEKKVEPRWVKNYDEILGKVCRDYSVNPEMIVPVFNKKVHELDLECNRQSRRFKLEEINNKIKTELKELAGETTEQQDENKLNELD